MNEMCWSDPADRATLPIERLLGNCGGKPNQRMYQNTATVRAETAGGTRVDDTDTSHYCNPGPKEELIFKNSFE
jgi:hypothetical protein